MSRKRQYNFTLPVDLGFFKMGMLKAQLHSNPNYNQIPADLRQKLDSGETVIHKEDLDKLPDYIWDEIARRAGLQYQYVEDDSTDFELGEEIGGAPPPRQPVKQVDKGKTETLRKSVSEQQHAVKQAAKGQKAPVSKGKSTDHKSEPPTHGGTSKK